MAGSVNKVILVGNLGKDPEVRGPSPSIDVVWPLLEPGAAVPAADAAGCASGCVSVPAIKLSFKCCIEDCPTMIASLQSRFNCE